MKSGKPTKNGVNSIEWLVETENNGPTWTGEPPNDLLTLHGAIVKASTSTKQKQPSEKSTTKGSSRGLKGMRSYIDWFWRRWA